MRACLMSLLLCVTQYSSGRLFQFRILHVLQRKLFMLWKLRHQLAGYLCIRDTPTGTGRKLSEYHRRKINPLLPRYWSKKVYELLTLVRWHFQNYKEGMDRHRMTTILIMKMLKYYAVHPVSELLITPCGGTRMIRQPRLYSFELSRYVPLWSQ
jgi:hypothetical protein